MAADSRHVGGNYAFSPIPTNTLSSPLPPHRAHRHRRSPLNRAVFARTVPGDRAGTTHRTHPGAPGASSPGPAAICPFALAQPEHNWRLYVDGDGMFSRLVKIFRVQLQLHLAGESSPESRPPPPQPIPVPAERERTSAHAQSNSEQVTQSRRKDGTAHVRSQCSTLRMCTTAKTTSLRTLFCKDPL